MNNVLLFIGGLLVALLSALFAVPHFVDWNGYRGVFEEEASRVLGREVRVGGEVNVRLLPIPYARFERVRVADVTGGTGEPFFRADAFTMWLSVSPLLRGVIEADQIELVRPRLKLQADASGRGNWTTLTIAHGSLPFVPAGVSLQGLRISDGSIGLATAGGGDELQLAGINGELEADAIDGPYKYKGSLIWRGAERHVRLATSKPDADGGIRLKSSISAPHNSNAYVLDGRISDLGGKVRFEGEVHGKLAFEARAATPVAPSTGSPAAAVEKGAAVQPGASAVADVGRPYLDLKAVVGADLTAARLDQLVLSVENIGQPQLVTGAGRITWTSNPSLELSLSSRWLDLDRLAGRESVDQPIDTAQSLVASLLGQLPESGRVDARFVVEQTTLGGEAVSGLALRLERSGGPLEIKELRAGLPGGARLDITGTLAEKAVTPELDGTMIVRGSSLARFMAWAGKHHVLSEGRSDGPFLVRGKLRLGATTAALSDASAELNGMPIAGSVRYELGEHRRVALRLDGQSVDLSQLWPGAIDWIYSVVPLLSPETDVVGRAAGLAPGVPASSRGDALRTDLSLQVRAAELVIGSRHLRDVDADIVVEKGRLSIPRLRLASGEGLEIDVEGEIADVAARPRGTLRWLVTADRPAAVEVLLRAVAGSEPVEGAHTQIAAAAPLRLAGRVSIGERGPGATDLDADGTIHGGRLVASARLGAGWRGWRDGQADISVSADSSDVDQILRMALASSWEPQRGRTPRRGKVTLRAQGVPGQGMLAAASFSSPGLVMNYDGQLKLQKGAPGAIDGELRITADDLTEVMELAGVPLGSAAAGMVADGLFHVTARDNVLTLRPRELLVGSHRIGGSLIIARRSGRTSEVTAGLDVGEITLSELLVPTLERPAPAMANSQAAPAAVGADAGGSAWPDLGFDLQVLDRLEGSVEVRFQGLRLKDGLALGPGRLVARLAPGRIDIETLEGGAMGGRLHLTGSLVRAKGGIDGKFSLRFADLKPGLLSSKGAAETSGGPPLSLSLELEARAASPRGMVSGFKGKGRVEFASLSLPGLTPAAIAARAEDFVGGRLPQGDDALTRALESAASEGSFVVPGGVYPIEVADGALRIGKVAVEMPGGSTTIDTTLELGTLRLDSEWRIEHSARASASSASTAGPRHGAALPPVVVVYAGDLGRIAALSPRVSGGALERELAVRKMERDVEQLERLRKEDERRRLEETQRQKALEAERARAAANPSPPSPATESGSSPGIRQSGAQPHSPAQSPSQGTTSAAPAELAAPVDATSQAPASAPQPVTVAPASAPQAGNDRAAPIRVAPQPRPVRRVSPGDEIMRQLSPN